LIAGQGTKLSRTMHDIRYSEAHDEFVVTNPFAKAILTFRGGASGEEAPVRIIQGPSTEIGPSMDRVDVDSVHDEIFVPNRDSVLVFPRGATGDTPPIRVIRGADTLLRRANSIAVDPIHDLIVVGYIQTASLREAEEAAAWDDGRGGLLIFGRTDNGNVKPRAIISGARTGLLIPEQLQIYAPGGWIIAAQSTDWPKVEPKDTFIGVWSIDDNGDAPPRWKLGGPTSQIKKPRGVALNPRNKELIVADMRSNAVLTFSFPELFRPVPGAPGTARRAK
jgi:DNA-binding beta-propeller fold protein YncE